MQSRLRLIAGPNGSGKTTLTNSIRKKLGDKFGIYVNADDMERILREVQTLDFNIYGLQVTSDEFAVFYQSHALYDRAGVSWIIIDNLFILKNALPAATYFPTLLADFIREALLANGASFAFETVMSESGKVDLLKRARENGYRTYLYYVCIEDPLVNVDRVAARVLSNGHNVPKDKIIDRYKRSLGNLLNAVRQTNRAYLYDNSGTMHELVAEITDGSKISFDTSFVPNWFEDALLKNPG